MVLLYKNLRFIEYYTHGKIPMSIFSGENNYYAVNTSDGINRNLLLCRRKGIKEIEFKIFPDRRLNNIKLLSAISCRY